MQGTECACNLYTCHLSSHGQVHVKNKAGLLFCLAVAPQHTGTGMQLQTASMGQSHLHIHCALGNRLLRHILLCQNAEIGRFDEFAPGHIGKPQIFPGKGVDIAQADPLKIEWLIARNEGRKNAIQPGCKIFPVAVILRGQGDKAVGQIDSPFSIVRYKAEICHRRLLLQCWVVCSQSRHLGRRALFLRCITGIFHADGFLKLGGFRGCNRQNRRKAQLADHIHQLAVLIFTPFFIG